MAPTPEDFNRRISQLQADLVDQGRRVLTTVETAFEAVFESDPTKAGHVATQDDLIDDIDVALEKRSVQLLTEACATTATLDANQLRMVLTLVKINNELERIADAAVDVAELAAPTNAVAPHGPASPAKFPGVFRVMANSVIGIVRDTITSVQRMDAPMSKVVLQSQHAVTSFKAAILRDAEQQIAKGGMSVDFAFRLHEVGSQCELIADHCTNIAEQIIYATTGAIVRHMASHWVEVPRS